MVNDIPAILMKQTATDVLIIGSGPVGAAFARTIHDALPQVNILMIDLGPRLTVKAGMHIKNIEDDKQREAAQVQSQGLHKKPYPLVTVSERAAAASQGHLNMDMLARAGTHLVSENEEDLKKNEMPAASYSSNIGGMGAHWTCACPRPGNEERIPFIPEGEHEEVFAKAERLLNVTQKAFADNVRGKAIQQILGSVLNNQLSEGRKVQPMPLACKTDENGARYWTGADVILGELAKADYEGNFELRSQTICRKLIVTDGHVSGALIEYLPAKEQETVSAIVVIVACDTLRTPQLLWASGIRPHALGHYLNEHPFIFCFVALNEALVTDVASEMGADSNLKPAIEKTKSNDQTVGVFWVPFDAPHHRFHGQIMHMDVSPLQIETHGNKKHIVGLGYGCLKEVRYEDHIEFSGEETDYLGMPKMTLHFTLTQKDKKQIEEAKRVQNKAAAAFGKVFKEGEQTVMPPGTSLHAQGTVRMGKQNDGTSVCNSYSQVWGYDNLFVGGNGVIPMSTTSNPTLTSVAMAVRACKKVISLLHKHS